MSGDQRVGSVDQWSSVPLFPLPGVVLFPRAVLPLHIFEQRYREMTADALGADRLIAMAMLLPGWEKDYHGRPAIEPVVCVGRIIRHERLDDGKYNILLQGVSRARVVREYRDRSYRYAMLAKLPSTQVLEIDLTAQRERLAELFATKPLSRAPLARQFRQLICSPISTTDLADLIAFHFVESASLKQSLLAESNVRRRVDRVVTAVESLLPVTAMLCTADSHRAMFN